MATVLIVDDDEAVSDTISIVLKEAGFVCQQATNGVEALWQMQSSRQRLVVLLDWMLPRMDGTAVLAAVAADPRLAGQHAIILMTAVPGALPQALLDLLDQLDVPLIAKPFDIDFLVEVVRGAAEALHASQRTVSAPPHRRRAGRVTHRRYTAHQRVMRRSRGGSRSGSGGRQRMPGDTPAFAR